LHELGLVSAAIAQAVTVANRAGATRVTGLSFAVASDGHITPEAIETLVAALGQGTLIEGAQVTVKVVPQPSGHSGLALTSVDVEVP
jgi:Zn finger protein HypA/HybF involved in hydrogenase expression